MVNRNMTFWKKYGLIAQDGFTFEADGDFLTTDTLWDFKSLDWMISP